MPDILIKAEAVSKKFCKRLRHSMLYGLQDIAKTALGVCPDTENLKAAEFWAIEDISFELKRGECLGLIGPNGSGKSTLLKILNGVLSPDKGRIEIRGRVGALIEVGAGFHPVLTGRENLYINGSILGFSKKEMDKKFDEIIAFAELEDFIDTPVKHYSSGMYVRLGFAIAAHLEPDIMLIDEVLAVGDVGFKSKCYNAIGKISEKTAIVFVSHSMPQIARMCSDICLVNRGKTVYQGKDVPKGMEHYYSLFEQRTGIVTGSGRATIDSIDFESKGRRGVQQINYLDDLTVHLQASINPEIKNPVCNISFLSQELQIVAQCNSSMNQFSINNQSDSLEISVGFPAINFNPGVYVLSVAIFNESLSETLTQHYAITSLKVCGDFSGRAPIQLKGLWNCKQAT